MFKIVVFFALIAFAMAGYLSAPTAVVYESSPEHPFASGYEYQHTIQTPDYVNHASVSAPLNGFAPIVRSVYTHPYPYVHSW